MKYSFIVLPMIVILLAGCSSNIKQAEQSTPLADSPKTITNTALLPLQVCYVTTAGKDSAHLKITIDKDSVTGSLMYKLHERDSNIGTIEGQITGDTLIADYKFMSEGIVSTRQVIFLLKDSTASEGYGDMEAKGSRMVFKNSKAISFGKGIKLHKAPCFQ